LSSKNHQPTWHHIDSPKHQIWANQTIANEVSAAWFSPEYWRNENAVIGQSKGRYVTYFVEHDLKSDGAIQPIKMVLRHYYRGGLVSKISKDRFWFSSFENTRAVKELNMLQQMRDLSLPVPNPVAAMVRKVGWFYCVNDILIELIENAKDGFQILSKQAFEQQQWQELGKTIRRFHEKGVFHSDLNIHNVILDNDGKFWLIDFDRCEFRQQQSSWQQQNLSRLKRSLDKEKSLQPSFHFEQQDWNALLQGYKA